MVEVREVEGRYEVFSPGRHWEAFQSRLSAHAAALGLADEIRSETGAFPEIRAPWPIRLDSGSNVAGADQTKAQVSTGNHVDSTI